MPRFNQAQILCWILTTCLTLVHGYVCNAQFTDSFTDGNFTANPVWTGTDTKFSIESSVLRLTAPAVSESAYLSTPNTSINNASWEFLVTINGSTSASNYTDVYLASDNAALTSSLNGYFVRIGNTSDEVSLYVQTGTSKLEIIDGLDGRVNQTSATIKIRVTRDESGAWQLFADAATGEYVLEGSVTNASHLSSAFAGTVCVYSSTRSQDYYFDDFIVTGDPYIDPSQPADFKDVIITEIFPDPSPVIGLPEAEFIEIYNRSEKIINLTGWKFADGGTTAILSGMLEPGQYRIITSTTGATQFASFGSTLGVTNFPTLNNSSDNLELRRADDLLIDKVSYTDAWYQDEDTKQGGFTLELIDPANPCGEGDNWIASESTTGGTPGTQNSVFENKPDLTGPKLLSVVPLSETSLSVTFNEKLQAVEPLATNFSITPEILVADISFVDEALTTLALSLNQSLQAKTLYALTTQNVYDCNGNEIQEDFSTEEFALPEPAEENDLIVNETLFNPRPTGVDFVEIYNTSNKYINLKDWAVGNYVNGEVENAEVISTNDVLLKPHSYLVLTEDRDIIKGQYVQAIEANILQVEGLPSFNDDEGTVALIDPENTIIDFFSYSDDYHSVFLKDNEGVSLERISSTALTNDAANWQSGSANSGFATPGYVNSSARGEILADKVKVEPEIFEPMNGSGFTQIHYDFAIAGYVANVKILDAQGREIKQLVNNSTLGTTGFFRWDGDMNDGSKARTGYYIVWMEVFSASGKVDTFRKRVVVASRFN